MYFRENNKSESQINILPMIDIIFAILSFFIVSSLFLTRIDSIKVNLPESLTATREKKKPLIITININEEIYLEQKLISINNLSKSVEKISKELENSLIIIRADSAVKHGFIVSVLDELRKIGDLKIGISTIKK